MKKCILAPDSFKGTMSSYEVSGIMKKVINKRYPNCNVLTLPMTDGGDGMVDCYLKILNGSKINLTVNNPYFEPIDSFYGIAEKTAVIEMAAAAGLNLVRGRMNPRLTSTYGVGELIKDAILKGCTTIILGLGGSCTNDAGAGMAAALGVKFYDENEETFIPTGGSLDKVKKIDVTLAKEYMAGIKLIALCDVNNIMYGRNGAAYVFATQKGADKESVRLLDENLQYFSETIKENLGMDVSQISGTGAAGAMGAGVIALLDGKLIQGVDDVLNLFKFEELADGCDYIFTGEGKLDFQSLSGKVVIGVSKRAKALGIPVIAIVGKLEGNKEIFKQYGINEIYETNKHETSLQNLQKICRNDLEKTMEEVLRKIREKN
jgi:glycerate kinase